MIISLGPRLPGNLGPDSRCRASLRGTMRRGDRCGGTTAEFRQPNSSLLHREFAVMPRTLAKQKCGANPLRGTFHMAARNSNGLAPSASPLTRGRSGRRPRFARSSSLWHWSACGLTEYAPHGWTLSTRRSNGARTFLPPSLLTHSVRLELRRASRRPVSIFHFLICDFCLLIL